MTKDLIFGKYIQDLNNIVRNEGVLKAKAFSNFTGERINLSEGLSPKKPFEHIEPLRLLLKLPHPQISTGTHPDFTGVGFTHVSEDHYIVSVFMDVKNSTVFFNKYNNNQIALIIQTIQAAAIAISSLFGGHIQRLQYDGLFVYFGGKGITQEKAIESALNATSFFSYFIKYELNVILKEYDFDKISTRAGIDFGKDDQVTWYRFGVQEASEVTTVSLHTSLAPKMQSKASANGIVIGNNVKEKLQLDNFVSVVKRVEDGKIVEDEYIFYKYRQHKFNWEAWLVKNFSFIKRDGEQILIDYDFNKDAELRAIKSSNDQLLRILGYSNGSTYISTTGLPNTNALGSPAPNNKNYNIPNGE
jgi:hypothetical protein